MPRCPSCGNELDAGAPACPRCGAGLGEPPLVRVWTTQGVERAEMMRGVLAGNGIEAMITGDGTAWNEVYRLSVGPMARVDVLVRERDAVRARAIVEEAERGDFELAEDSDPEA